MCTDTTEQAPVPGSGNGSDGWFSLRTATVYYGHPVHTPAWHTLNIDFANPAEGPSARVAVETHSAVRPALVDAIRAALAAVPRADDGALDRGPVGSASAAGPDRTASELGYALGAGVRGAFGGDPTRCRGLPMSFWSGYWYWRLGSDRRSRR